MEFTLPLFAVQRQANGTWLVRTLMGDPIMPPVGCCCRGGRANQRRAARHLLQWLFP